MDSARLDSAIQCQRECLHAVRRLYLSVEPWEDGYDVACAETAVPDQYADAVRLARVALEHMMNLRDFH